MRQRGTIFIVLFLLIAAGIIGASRFLGSQPATEYTLAVDPLAQGWAEAAVSAFNASQPTVNTHRIQFRVGRSGTMSSARTGILSYGHDGFSFNHFSFDLLSDFEWILNWLLFCFFAITSDVFFSSIVFCSSTFFCRNSSVFLVSLNIFMKSGFLSASGSVCILIR